LTIGFARVNSWPEIFLILQSNKYCRVCIFSIEFNFFYQKFFESWCIAKVIDRYSALQVHTEAHMAASSSSLTSLTAPYGGGAAAFVAALTYLDPISSSHNGVNEMACLEVCPLLHLGVSSTNGANKTCKYQDAAYT
jgi:hypothetical protein